LQKFIIISILFHISLLIVVQLDIIEIKSEKRQAISIGVLEEKPPQIKKEEPKKVIKKKPKKVIKEEPKKVIKKEPKKVVEKKPKKVIKKKPKKVVEKKPKKVIKKEPKKVVERFDDLLKDLASENFEDEIKKSNIDNKIKELSNNKLLENTTEIKKVELSLIEKIILEQIDNNWTRPPGIKIAKNLVIKLIITLDTDGNVIKLALHKKTQADILNNITLQPYLDSAVRAIKKSSPFEGLRKDRYSIWKEIIINFKPIEAR